MKKNILALTLLGGLCYLLFSSHTNGLGATSSQDATGASGAGTGANQGCVNGGCHSSMLSTIAVTVELDSAGISVNNYHPGLSYTVKIKGINNSTSSLPYFGFQLSCVKANSTNAGGSNTAGSPACVQAGTWGVMPASVRITTSGGFPQTLIEQSTPIIATTGTGGTGTTYVESIPWTAPAAGSGSVAIYGILNAVNHDGGASGDICNIANTLIIYEAGHTQSCGF